MIKMDYEKFRLLCKVLGGFLVVLGLLIIIKTNLFAVLLIALGECLYLFVDK